MRWTEPEVDAVSFQVGFVASRQCVRNFEEEDVDDYAVCRWATRKRLQFDSLDCGIETFFCVAGAQWVGGFPRLRRCRFAALSVGLSSHKTNSSG